ncbi:DUF1566 domain-containing protein, partial [Sulfuricurvum sp.]|uniref:Lcl domain-containing protein n=1 Tax=Sulfuricurvum sp. TaxID=2025608 RepID=UPI003BB6908D
GYLMNMTKTTLICLLALSLSSTLYALPPQVEADRLGLAAKTAMEAKDYKTAVEKLEAMQKLGVKLPDTFSYHYGVSLLETGRYKDALAMFDEYLSQGQGAKFYKEALERYNLAERFSISTIVIDKNNEVILDVKTKLMWQDQLYSSDDKYNRNKLIEGGKVWQGDGGNRYCKNLTLAGYSNWRLPTPEELETIVPIKNSFRSIAWLLDSDEQGGNFLTSIDGIQFNMSFNSQYESKSSCYVRCVRDNK